MKSVFFVALTALALQASTRTVLGFSLEGGINEDPTIDPQGICKRVGSEVCGFATCVPLPGKESFQCNCRDDEFYDAFDKKCKHWQSCGPLPCSLGYCIDDEGTKKRRCSCKGMPWLTEFCRIRDDRKFMCEERHAKAVLREGEVECDCGPAMKHLNKTCVPISCLNFTMTCEELCNKNLLDKDNRCCQGWNASNCSAGTEIPDKNSCAPGYIFVGGECKDACTAKAASPVCPDGCSASQNGHPFECRCKNGWEVAKDGLTCTKKRTTCTEEEKKLCREDQICYIANSKPKCACRYTEQEKDGVCTNKCYTKNCDEVLATCVVKDDTERCICSPPFTVRRGYKTCTLEQYSYILHFRTNDSSPYSDDICESKKLDISAAMKTLFGKQLVDINHLSCKETFVMRLVFSKKQDPAVLKRVETCQYPRGDVCIFPPRLYIKETSVKIEEENLCGEYFRQQLNGSNGMHVCRKDGDNYVLECRDGLYGYKNLTNGRITRWSCTDKKETITTETSTSDTIKSDSQTSPREDTTTKMASTKEDLTSSDSQVSTQEGTTTEMSSTKEDPCSITPCLNGGVCKPGTGGTFSCQCPQGFKGDRCEHKNGGASVDAPITIIAGTIISLLLLR